MIRLVEPEENGVFQPLLAVYAGLRDWNLREIEAAFPGHENPLAAGFEFHLKTPAIRRFVYRDEEPIAAAGCIRLDNDTGRLYFIGTPEVEEHGVRIAAVIRRFLPQAAKQHGITRLECSALQGNPKTHRWFEALGGVFTRSEQDSVGNLFDRFEWSFSDVSR